MAAGHSGIFTINKGALQRARSQTTPPRDIGEYSFEVESGFHDDARRKRFYKAPEDPDRVEFNLYAGHEDFVCQEKDRKTYLCNILRWLQAHHRELEGGDAENAPNLPVDFVCRRGLLTDMLTTPYDRQNGLRIMVSKFKGTHYVLGLNSREEQQEVPIRADHDSELNRRLYGGSKFPLYLLANEADGSPDPDQPVDSLSGYYRVFTRNVGGHKLLYSGEVDGVDESAPEGEQYVEFKSTVDKPQRYPTLPTFPFIKWWAQSSNVGINRIVVGLHGSPMGVVKRLKFYDVAGLPEKNYRYPWQPKLCYNFLDAFLTHIKTTVTADDPKEVYIFERRADDNRILCKEAGADSPHIFLPDWYVDSDGWN